MWVRIFSQFCGDAQVTRHEVSAIHPGLTFTPRLHHCGEVRYVVGVHECKENSSTHNTMPCAKEATCIVCLCLLSNLYTILQLIRRQVERGGEQVVTVSDAPGPTLQAIASVLRILCTRCLQSTASLSKDLDYKKSDGRPASRAYPQLGIET